MKKPSFYFKKPYKIEITKVIMKTWIKGGLWGLGTGIFLEIISAIGGFICTSLVEGEALVCLGILFLPILPVFSLLGTFLDGNLLTVNSIAIISIVLYLIIVFTC